MLVSHSSDQLTLHEYTPYTDQTRSLMRTHMVSHTIVLYNS